jgi:hypothetical protein
MAGIYAAKPGTEADYCHKDENEFSEPQIVF